MQTRGVQAARGCLAAVAATATAAASHTLAAAEAPSPQILALAVAFAAVVCVLLAGRRLSLPRLAASVLLSQLAYHALFLVAGGGGAVSVAGTGPHVHGASTVQLISGAQVAHSHTVESPAMLAAHLAAAALTIAALRHGERIFWTLGASLLRVVVRIVARASALVAPTGPSVALLGTPETSAPRALDAVLTILRHRGPPARVLLAV